MRPRRGDAHAEAEVLARSGRDWEGAQEEHGHLGEGLDVAGEPDEAEVDATLRPLARALLALAEQLMGEEAP